MGMAGAWRLVPAHARASAALDTIVFAGSAPLQWRSWSYEHEKSGTGVPRSQQRRFQQSNGASETPFVLIRTGVGPVLVDKVKWLRRCISGVFDAAALLEGLSQTVARLVRGRALQRELVIRTRVVQHAEPQDRQPAEAEPGRLGEWRAGGHGRSRQGPPVQQGPVRDGRGRRPRGAEAREHQ